MSAREPPYEVDLEIDQGQSGDFHVTWYKADGTLMTPLTDWCAGMTARSYIGGPKVLDLSSAAGDIILEDVGLGSVDIYITPATKLDFDTALYQVELWNTVTGFRTTLIYGFVTLIKRLA